MTHLENLKIFIARADCFIYWISWSSIDFKDSKYSVLFGLFVIFRITYTTSKRWRGELKKEEDFTTEQVEGSEDLHVAPNGN